MALPAGSVFLWSDVYRRVALEAHRLGLDAIRVMSDASARIGYARNAGEPIADGVPPDDGMPSLVLEPRQHLRITLLIHLALERTPLPHHGFRLLRAIVVRVIDVLNHRLSGMQRVSVGHVVEKQKQLVGSSLRGLVEPCHAGGVLRNKTSARGRAAIHADAFMISPVPLAPAISLRRLDPGPVVASQNVGQCSCA